MDAYNGLLTNEEIEQVKKIFECKRNLTSYMDMDKFIDEARDIITNSQNFDFRNNQARDYIDKNKPIFILSLKNNEIYNDLIKREDSEARDIVNDIVYDEIIKKLSERLVENLEGRIDVFKDVPKSLTFFLISNIYVLRSNIRDNNIQIFFFI